MEGASGRQGGKARRPPGEAIPSRTFSSLEPGQALQRGRPSGLEVRGCPWESPQSLNADCDQNQLELVWASTLC